MRTSRMTSPQTDLRNRPPDLEDLNRPLHTPPPTDTDSIRRHCQSPRFHRIQVLVDEETRGSPLGSPLSPRRTPRKLSRESRDSTPDPPSYRDVISGSPNIANEPHFDFPPLHTSSPSTKVQVIRKTEVYSIETSAEENNPPSVKNDIMDLNSNFPERNEMTSSVNMTSTSTPDDGLRKCPGGDHDHRLCRQQLDDIHAQLQAMMNDAINGQDTTDSMTLNNNTVNTTENFHHVIGSGQQGSQNTTNISEQQYQTHVTETETSHTLLSSTLQRQQQEQPTQQIQQQNFQQTILLEQQLQPKEQQELIQLNLQQKNRQIQQQQIMRHTIHTEESFANEHTQNTVHTSNQGRLNRPDNEPRPSGPCSCCPYGYHIDLTFLGIFDQINENDNLDRLIQIRKDKKRLRKSMEIYLQQHQNGDEGSDEGTCLMAMMEEDEEATREMLNEIDDSVDATIASIDHLIQAGRVPRKLSMPELDESEMSVGSGPQNTSSPKPNGALIRRGSTESLSSLDASTASDQNARLIEQNDVTKNTTVTNLTNMTNITTITSHQIAVNMANCFDTIRNESSENMVAVTPEQLRKMREQIALSLQRMKELEEQVKAIPVLQVRISVLKEEKRLLALQNEAKNKRMSKSYRSIGVGEHTIDEPERRGSRSRSQSPSFEMSDFASIRRGRRTPLPNERVTTEETGVGSGDVRNLYYLQPHFVSQEEFIETAKVLLPEHIKVKVNEEPEEEEPLFSTRFVADDKSPWLLTDEIDSPDAEFTRIENALEQDSAVRFFNKPEDIPEHLEMTSDSDESTTTVTTTKTTKIFETTGFGSRLRGEVIKVPEVIRPPKPVTRDFGQTFNEEKPCLVDVGIGVGENMDLSRSDDSESDYDEYGRKIVTTTTVTRKNMLLQEQRVKMALREALHRDVKSVGVNVRFSTTDQSTLTEFITTNDVGCSDDTIDVTIKPKVWLRSMGTEVKPSTNNHSTWTDKELMTNAGTNTTPISQSSKTTNTTKMLTFPAATNTEKAATHTVGVGMDRRTMYALNIINNQGSNTEGLCTCGPNYEGESDVTETLETVPGEEDDESTRTSTTTRRRIVSYETNPISISVNRDYRTSLSARTSPTSTSITGFRTSAMSDTEADTESSFQRSSIELNRRPLELERVRLTTHERHFPVQTSQTIPPRFYSQSTVSKPRRISGPSGDTLLVKRVKSYGHNLYSNRSAEPHYSDHTDLGSYMSTVSTNQTLDIGPSSDTADPRIKTFTPHAHTIGDYPRGQVVIERTSTSSSTMSEPNVVDIVETESSPTKREPSQSDIFGSETSSTIIRKSTKESTSSTTTVEEGAGSTESSPKRKSRRAKLDGASMLSGPTTGEEVTLLSETNRSLSSQPMLQRSPGELNISMDLDIPLARQLATTGIPSGTTSMGGNVTVTSSMTSSVSSITSSKTLGPDGQVIENISADNEFSSTDPGAKQPEFDLRQEVEKFSSGGGLDSIAEIGTMGSILTSPLGANASTQSSFTSTSLDSQSGSQEYSTSREIRSIDGQGTLKEETTKKVDGAVVEHDIKHDTFVDGSAAKSSLVLNPISSTPVSHFGSNLNSSNITPEAGSLNLMSLDNQLGQRTVTSSMTSSVSSITSSTTLGPDGRVIENISADNEFTSTDPGAKQPEVDLKQEMEKLSSEYPLSDLNTSTLSAQLTGGATLQPASDSFQRSLSGMMATSADSTSGVLEYSESRQVHSVGGQGTLKEEKTRKEDGQIIEHTVKSDTFTDTSTTGSMGTISIGKPMVVKPVVKPVSTTNVRFLRTKLQSDVSEGAGSKTRADDEGYVRSKEVGMTSSSGGMTSSSGGMTSSSGGMTSSSGGMTSSSSGMTSSSSSRTESSGSSGSLGLQISPGTSSYSSERSRIPTLHSEKSLTDFKQESARLKSRLLKTEAVLGDFSATASGGDSLLFSNVHADGSGGHTMESSSMMESTSTSEGTSTSLSKSTKIDGVTVESVAEKRSSGKTSPHKTSPKQPKSIMKKSSGKKEKSAERKAIKFAAGTVGGYVSTSSDSDSDSDTSDTSTGSESSFEEGSYDGREGKITYRCQDNMAKAAKDTASFTALQDSNSRDTFELSAIMRRACETANDHLLGRKDIPTKLWNESLSSLQDEWFRVAGQRLTNPQHAETLIGALRAYSAELLEKIVNLMDANGNTCLHYAVSYCNFETLSLLLDTRVCDVNKTNKAGYTPIMLASLAQVQMDRQKEILRYLFREGNVNLKAAQAGQTALMLAVSHGRKEMVKLLLDCGADINAQDDDGSTALMCACEHGHGDIVKVLLAQPECNATLVDNDGSTALSIAMESDHRDIAVLLYAKLGIKKTGSPIP